MPETPPTYTPEHAALLTAANQSGFLMALSDQSFVTGALTPAFRAAIAAALARIAELEGQCAAMRQGLEQSETIICDLVNRVLDHSGEDLSHALLTEHIRAALAGDAGAALAERQRAERIAEDNGRRLIEVEAAYAKMRGDFMETCERLRECGVALAPFAEYGKSLPLTARTDYPLDDGGDRTDRKPLPTVGDCRRAAEAYRKLGEATPCD